MRIVGIAFLAVILACFLAAQMPVIAQEKVEEEKLEQEKAENGEEKEEQEKEEEKDDEKEEEKEKNSQVRMKDGTYVEGVVGVETFEVETEYGKLLVPRDEIVKVRIGKAADKELKKKILDLIAKLGDEEFKVREDATKELGGLGQVALEEIRAATRNEDVEVKTRAEKLVKEIESSLAPDAEEVIDDDEIITKKFTIRGTLLIDKLVIKTRYGTITAEKKEIETLVVSKPMFEEKTVVVSGSSNAGTEYMKDSGITIKKGQKLSIKTTGNVHIGSYGVSASPDGTPNRSSHYGRIPLGALMGKIGPNGKLFKVGSSYVGVADQGGKLFLGVAVRSGYSTSGDFRAKVQVEKK